jgi:hypothetical protein
MLFTLSRCLLLSLLLLGAFSTARVRPRLPRLALPLHNSTVTMLSDERDALIALYNQTQGPSWFSSSGWLQADPCAQQWYGVTCDATGRVQRLQLSRNGLNGTLPVSLSRLTALIQLDLSDNSLQGATAAIAGSFPVLRELSLWSNNFEGDLDLFLSGLTAPALEILYVDINWFNGSIPASLCRFTQLTALDVGFNELVGALPPCIGGLRSLQYLWIYSVVGSGPVPPEYCALTNLIEVILSRGFSGSLPACMSGLESLRRLKLEQNLFTGSLEFICNLTSIEEVQLDGNSFQGLPACMASLTSLRRLSCQKCGLAGPLSDMFGALRSLRSLNLAYNNISGLLPPSMANLSALTELNQEQFAESIGGGHFATSRSAVFNGGRPLQQYDFRPTADRCVLGFGRKPRYNLSALPSLATAIQLIRSARTCAVCRSFPVRSGVRYVQ